MTLVLAFAAEHAQRSTLAFYTSSFASQPNAFGAGVVDVSASGLPTTVFSWSTSGTTGNCATVLPGTPILTQGITPGSYCVHAVTLRNTHASSGSAWMRLRLVRQTPSGTAQTDALNNQLRVYMSEYTGVTAATLQSTGCNTTNFKPVPPVAGTATSDSVIANTPNRIALTTLGPSGKNIGTHPGTPVTSLAGTGLGLTTGPGVAPAEGTMSTDSTATATYNAYNLVGNDEITNPTRSDLVTSNGTRPGGTNAESEILAQSSRYYCFGIFYPSDTGLTQANLTGDNAAQNGSVTYHLVLSAAQKAGRTVS